MADKVPAQVRARARSPVFDPRQYNAPIKREYYQKQYDRQASRETNSGTPHANKHYLYREAYVNKNMRDDNAWTYGSDGFAVDVQSKPQLIGASAMTAMLGVGIGTLGMTIRGKIRGYREQEAFNKKNTPSSLQAPASAPTKASTFKKPALPSLSAAAALGIVGGIMGAAVYYVPRKYKKRMLIAANVFTMVGATIILFATANYARGVDTADIGITDQYAFAAALFALSTYSTYDCVRA